MSIFSKHSYASLVDDISHSLSSLCHDGHDYDDDKEQYDSEFNDLPEDLWQEQQDIQRLRTLEQRRDRLDELFWAYQELYKRTIEEIEQLEEQVNS